MSVIQSWNPEAVRQMVLKTLTDNAELTGKYLETEARRRLDGIKEPSDKRFLGYRWFLSKHLLTNTVKVTRDAVVIAVGMKTQAKKGGDRHGFYIEIGSKSAPAQPYLRPAVFQNAREILQLLSGQ